MRGCCNEYATHWKRLTGRLVLHRQRPGKLDNAVVSVGRGGKRPAGFAAALAALLQSYQRLADTREAARTIGCRRVSHARSMISTGGYHEKKEPALAIVTSVMRHDHDRRYHSDRNCL
jgi:hypothetical protein